MIPGMNAWAEGKVSWNNIPMSLNRRCFDLSQQTRPGAGRTRLGTAFSARVTWPTDDYGSRLPFAGVLLKKTPLKICVGDNSMVLSL